MSTHPMPSPSAATEQVRREVIEGRARSVAHLFRDRIAATPDAEAFRPRRRRAGIR